MAASRSSTLASNAVTVVSVLLYVACLFLVPFYLQGERPGDEGKGYMVLFTGWLGVLGGGFSWLANPALFLSWGLLRTKRGAASVAAAFAVFLMLCFLGQQEIAMGDEMRYTRITGYGAGYWLWLCSAVAQLIACWVRRPSARTA